MKNLRTVGRRGFSIPGGCFGIGLLVLVVLAFLSLAVISAIGLFSTDQKPPSPVMVHTPTGDVTVQVLDFITVIPKDENEKRDMSGLYQITEIGYDKRRGSKVTLSEYPGVTWTLPVTVFDDEAKHSTFGVIRTSNPEYDETKRQWSTNSRQKK